VLEMSSYMLERIVQARFDVAVMLNLSPDHLDRHGDMAGYAAAKREIFARQDKDCTAVIGIDDQPSREIAAWLDTQPGSVIRISGENFSTVPAPALPGTHNAQNAAAAFAAARALGVPEQIIAQALLSYPGLPHRQQNIAKIDGIAFINDSKATNADAAARAMGCYDRFIWIAGGVAKEGGINALAGYFPRIAKAYLIGRDGPIFAATLAAHNIPHDEVETLERAMPAAFAAAKQTGAATILFSPAAASFDQFANFEARGAQFATLVRSLA